MNPVLPIPSGTASLEDPSPAHARFAGLRPAPRAAGMVCVLGALLLVSRAGAADRDWPDYLGDAANSHYSPLRQIDRSNVTRLQPAWTFNTGDALPNSQIQCNPLIVDGVLYGSSPQLRLFSLDAATGREHWRFDPFAVGRDAGGGRGVNRGLVLVREGRRKVLYYTAGPFLYAVDAEDGTLVRSFGEGGRVDLLQGLGRDVSGLSIVATTPGAVFRDLLIVSTRVGEGPGPSAPGHIRAYDLNTGERRWIFHTIPWPGEFGHDTWPEGAWREAGGANCWAGMAIDQDRGLVFVPTGSAAFDFWGGNRAGDNLFANCLLALDAMTGERRWHFQFVRHDLWDRDLPAPPVLCEVRRDGRTIAAVAQVTKSGHAWVFDRETGESLFPWHEVRVPGSMLAGEKSSPTQPFPLGPEPFARQVFTEEEATDRTPAAREAVLARLRQIDRHEPFAPPSTRGTVVLPGFDGGAEWGGAAVDPDGILYVNSNEMAWILQMIPADVLDASLGESLYTQLCTACHGPDRAGNAAQNIASLVGLETRMKAAEITSLLDTGRGVMPAFRFLKPPQRAALIDYLLGGAGAPAASSDPGSGGVPGGPEAPDAVIPFTTAGYNRFFDPDGYPALRPPWGTLNAINLHTGEYVWRRPLGELPELTAQGIPPTGTENYGGPLVTAGGLLFIAATKDEKFRAFDTATGGLLWEFALPAGGYATPATYAVNGRQYVVIACG
ncbi:MAG: PQQ-binding-like beta-propeller repeat protein, partial [Opitutus sp.]